MTQTSPTASSANDNAKDAKEEASKEAKSKDAQAKKDEEDSEEPGSSRLLRWLLGGLAILAVTFAGLLAFVHISPGPGDELTIDQVYELAARGQIHSATLLEEDTVMIGWRCLEGGTPPPDDAWDFPADREACPPPLEAFHASYPQTDVGTEPLIWRLSRGGAEVDVRSQPFKAIASLLTLVVYPVLFLALVFGLIFLTRSSSEDSSMSDIAGFGRMGKKSPATHGGSDGSEVVAYTSFWRRLAAYALDGLGLLLFGVVLGLLAGVVYGIWLMATGVGIDGWDPRTINAIGWVVAAVALAAYFAYETVATSRWGATLGKRAVGIEVRTPAGELLPRQRAAVRSLGRLASTAPLLLGFFWAIWDTRRQTWHDKFAGSVVVARGATPATDEAPAQKRPGTVTFADVGGAEEAVTELKEVTDYLKDPGKFEAYGAAAPKGALLFGPPGCGKTLLARAVAGEAGVPFFAVSGAEFIESLVGVGAARVRDLFAQVRKVAPAIVFIDEIDAVGRKRSGEGVSGGEREQTVNQLLVEMDGFEVGSGIVLMGATNRSDILDPALMRPGRFDRHVTLEPPDITGRKQILELHARSKPIAGDVDFDLLARRTPGYTGADLANVINEAALLTIRQGGGSAITMSHLSEAVERVLHGPQRRGKLMTSDERRRLAYHESGHAMVAAVLGHAGSVQRVSILGRGRGLGSSMISLDTSDRVLLTTGELHSQVAMAMGGIAAEQLEFAELSTTSEDDLDKANGLAREMVGVYGMSAEVGMLRLLRPEEGFLGSDVHVVEAISGQTLGAFDAAVRARIDEALSVATDILSAHRRHLDAIAQALIDHETLEGGQLDQLLSAVPVGVPSHLSGDGNEQKARRAVRRPQAGPARPGRS